MDDCIWHSIASQVFNNIAPRCCCCCSTCGGLAGSCPELARFNQGQGPCKWCCNYWNLLNINISIIKILLACALMLSPFTINFQQWLHFTKFLFNRPHSLEDCKNPTGTCSRFSEEPAQVACASFHPMVRRRLNSVDSCRVFCHIHNRMVPRFSTLVISRIGIIM